MKQILIPENFSKKKAEKMLICYNHIFKDHYITLFLQGLQYIIYFPINISFFPLTQFLSFLEIVMQL